VHNPRDAERISKLVINDLLTSFLDNIFPNKNKELINEYTKINIPAIFIRSTPSLIQEKSLLTSQLKTLNRKKLRRKYLIDTVPDSDPNHFHLLVSLLNTKKVLDLHLSCKCTVEQVIKYLVNRCVYDKELGVNLVYRSHRAYDLRILFDDEVIYDLRPLTRNSKLEDINLDTVAFCANKDYVPSKRGSSFVTKNVHESQVFRRISNRK
jgi:hypothetical protein